MPKRRGFFAEIQRQAKIAAREQARRAREAERAQNAANRAIEQARRAEERTAVKLANATAAEQKRLEKQAREAHVAAMEAEVERRNAELSTMYEAIDSLLSATLEKDDFLDLTTLRVAAEHPTFDRPDLEIPIPAPEPIPDPPEPVFTPPTAPRGIAGLLGAKKHEVAVAKAAREHQGALEEWQSAVAQATSARRAAVEQHAVMESVRLEQLEGQRARYAAECAAREEEAAERNEAMDALIANLGYGTKEAVEEYVSIIFINSSYPAPFPVEHDFEFNPETAELYLRVLVPGPDDFPTTSAYRYTKSSDEITAVSLSAKARKDRYNHAVLQVALRSLHEVFEADRRGLIKTVSLEVGPETNHPATGQETYIPLVAVAAERESFRGFDLKNVVPAATLDYLGATVSKNPYGLVPASAAGIRRT